LKIASIFLLGRRSKVLGKSEVEREAKCDEMISKLGLSKELKFLVMKEDDILRINTYGMDGFVLFPYCNERFSALINLAESKLPIIVFSEENNFGYALDTYEYLAEHKNVEIAYNPEELKQKINAFKTVKLLQKMKICVFDSGDWKLDGAAWFKNPIISGRLNTQNINKEKFLEAYRNADRKKAESLAKKWMREAEKVLEPKFEDVVKSAMVYLAMKKVMEDMKADAAYVLWCGQFTKELGTKMCFALAKLADDGYPVGCWRGENLLPLLILHTISKKPIFVCEAYTRKGKVITLRHCFAPTTITSSKYILRRWRNMKGTVTGYCQLPKGEVTLVNCGSNDRLVVVKGKVLDCKDLGGDNCRMTIWVELENEDIIRSFVGREFAMVYGNYEKEVKQLVTNLGLHVL
jgi:L-fucose isomerase-like protein